MTAGEPVPLRMKQLRGPAGTGYGRPMPRHATIANNRNNLRPNNGARAMRLCD